MYCLSTDITSSSWIVAASCTKDFWYAYLASFATSIADE